MYRRGSVNINDLINRFESVDDITSISENIQNFKPPRPGGRMHKFADDDEFNNSLEDENRLVRYIEKQKRFDRRSNAKMSSAKEITKQTIANALCRLSGFLEMVSKFPFPRMSVLSFGITSLLAVFLSPRGFTERALYPGFRIVFAIIFPAYRSFKAVRNKNLKEYMKWLIYWIVFSFFTCFELISDALMSWLPLYFELKMIFLIWILGPSSKGGMKLYKTLIHPTLMSHEQEIDDIIQVAEDRGYMHIFRLGSKSFKLANTIIMQENQINKNIPISHQLMRNISLSNLSDVDMESDANDSSRSRIISIENTSAHDNQSLIQRPRGNHHFHPRYDSFSSGYSSPGSIQASGDATPQALLYKEDQINRMLLQNPESIHDQNENKQPQILSEEILLEAYEKLQRKQKEPLLLHSDTKTELSHELQSEILKWMEWKQRSQKADVKSSPDEGEVKSINENLQVNKQFDNSAREPSVDFDEFKDVIHDNEDEEKPENLELVKLDESDLKSVQEKEESTLTIQEAASASTSSENDENLKPEGDLIEAKMTLGNAQLKIVTNFSSSNASLASSDDSSVGGKMPVKHSKGRAPAPPGQFYDQKTRKHFKETEL